MAVRQPSKLEVASSILAVASFFLYPEMVGWLDQWKRGFICLLILFDLFVEFCSPSTHRLIRGVTSALDALSPALPPGTDFSCLH